MTLADRCHWSLHLFSGRAESPQAAGWPWWAAAWRKHPWSISRKLWPCFTLPIFQFVQRTKPWNFILGNRFNCLKCKLGPGNSINRQGFLFGSVMHSHFKSFLIDLYVLGSDCSLGRQINSTPEQAWSFHLPTPISHLLRWWEGTQHISDSPMKGSCLGT